MASSKDVRDIMNLGAAPSPQPPSMSAPPPTRQQPKKVKRPEGITRELFALMGGNAPALALAQPVKPKFKERFKPRAGPSVKWQWTRFTVPSRAAQEGTEAFGTKEDEARRGLRLGHWCRDLAGDHVEGGPDPKFEKFNTTSGAMSYSNDEYDKMLKGQSSWGGLPRRAGDCSPSRSRRSQY